MINRKNQLLSLFSVICYLIFIIVFSLTKKIASSINIFVYAFLVSSCILLFKELLEPSDDKFLANDQPWKFAIFSGFLGSFIFLGSDNVSVGATIIPNFVVGIVVGVLIYIFLYLLFSFDIIIKYIYKVNIVLLLSSLVLVLLPRPWVASTLSLISVNILSFANINNKEPVLGHKNYDKLYNFYAKGGFSLVLSCLSCVLARNVIDSPTLTIITIPIIFIVLYQFLLLILNWQDEYEIKYNRAVLSMMMYLSILGISIAFVWDSSDLIMLLMAISFFDLNFQSQKKLK